MLVAVQSGCSEPRQASPTATQSQPSYGPPPVGRIVRACTTGLAGLDEVEGVADMLAVVAGDEGNLAWSATGQ